MKPCTSPSCVLGFLVLLCAAGSAKSVEPDDAAAACVERGSSAALILHRLQLGKLPLPEHWDAQRAHASRDLVEGAKTWPRGVDDYGAYVYLDCLDRQRKGAFRKTASSQPLPAPAPAQWERCAQKLQDNALIGRAVAWRASKETLQYIACRGGGLDEQRRAKMLRLIDEAYAAGNVHAWYASYVGKCLRAEPEYTDTLDTPQEIEQLEAQNDTSCRQVMRDGGGD